MSRALPSNRREPEGSSSPGLPPGRATNTKTRVIIVSHTIETRRFKKKREEKQNRWQPQTTIERRRLIDPFEQCKHRQHSASANTETASEKTSPRAEECRLARLNGERPFCGPTRLSSASSSSELLCQHNKTPGDRRETNQDLGP